MDELRDCPMKTVKTSQMCCYDENDGHHLMMNIIEDLQNAETIAEIPEVSAAQGLAYVRYQQMLCCVLYR